MPGGDIQAPEQRPRRQLALQGCQHHAGCSCLHSLLSLWVQPLNCSQVFNPAHLGTLKIRHVCALVTRSHWRSQGRETLQLGCCSLVRQSSLSPSLLPSPPAFEHAKLSSGRKKTTHLPTDSLCPPRCDNFKSKTSALKLLPQRHRQQHPQCPEHEGWHSAQGQQLSFTVTLGTATAKQYSHCP